MQWALRSLEAESENFVFLVLFPNRESNEKSCTTFCPYSNTNFLKCTICPVFQHQHNLKTGYSPIPLFISPTVAAVKWITLLHALKQDSNLFSTTKLVAMVIKLWNPWHNSQTAMLWWYNDQNRNRKEHLKYKDTLKKLNFLHSLI